MKQLLKFARAIVDAELKRAKEAIERQADVQSAKLLAKSRHTQIQG